MDFVIAVVIGIVIGGVAGYALRGRGSSTLWLTPALSVVGALVATIIAVIVSNPGYGWKEAVLQVVLALVGAGAGVMLSSRRPASA
jgi:uncharacterized membrane protein